MKFHIENLNLHLHAARPLMADAILKAITERSTDAANVRSTIALPRIGQVWDEQRGTFLGVMPGVNGGRDYALILPVSKDTDLGKRPWGERNKDIPGATSSTDGAGNTKAMADAGYALATEVLGMEVDGFSGLYIPARHEARLAYLMAADLFDKDSLHWTSTQCSPSYAWYQNFDGGNQYGNSLKSNEGVVRLVRRLFL
jgi:hypothetical protein